MIGKTLAHYEITGLLGKGGMGEVYSARDTKLGRDVAIKVLPGDLATHPERLARFEREAKAIAALNHPNIVTVHSVEETQGLHLLTMELVEGNSLDQILPARGMELEQLFPLAIQIAAALAAAHEKGIVHRDLKPSNVMMTDEGRVKVLDFGLAKLAEQADETEKTQLMTQDGVILGTVPYMSPEGVQGQAVDHRSDIFSLGIVLYEMATGSRPFEGSNTASVISAILKDHPPVVTEIKSELPNHLARIVRRCLHKQPQRRYQSAKEVQLELEELEIEQRVGAGSDGPRPADMASVEATSEARASAPPTPGPRSNGRWIGGIVVVGLVAAFGGWWMGQRTDVAGETWSQFTQLTDMEGAETGPALSPDGDSFAYSSRAAGSWDIYTQRVGGRIPTAVVADPERDEKWPAFSPDGRLIAYNESDRDGGIWVVGATGESDRRLTDFGFHPTWSPDGDHIAFVTEETVSPNVRAGTAISTLWSVPASGGPPVQLSESDVMQPAWSPSGRRFAVWVEEGGQRDIATLAAEGNDTYTLLLDDAPLDWSPTWSPDGKHLYFSSDRGGSMGLWRIAVDEASGRALGAPEPVARGLEASIAIPSLSSDGRVLAFRSSITSVNPVAIPFDPVTEQAGPPRELISRTGILRPSSVSSNGEWLALYNLGERQEDIFLLRTDGSGLRRLTDDDARDRVPRFSPDDKLLSFFSNRGGGYAGYSIRVDGSALTPLSGTPNENLLQVTFEPNGERLLVMTSDGHCFIAHPPWPFTMDSVSMLEEIELPAGTLLPGLWSPDGRMISGPLQGLAGELAGVGVYDLESGEGRQLSADPGIWIAPWLPDSQRIIYFTLEGELVIIDVATAERRVVPVDLPFPPARVAFAVAPDGTSLYYGAMRIESNIWMVERAR